jgi:alkylhydroperoxidase/carboxymuconolactone decarboxylase family protein YurZ
MTTTAPAADRIAEWMPPSAWLGQLADRYPAFAEGLARLGDVLFTDAALPATSKMLFAAAIAAVKRDEMLVDHFMSKVAAGGLPVEHVDGACVGVLNSRGVVPHSLLAAARDAHYKTVPATATSEVSWADNADVASARTYFEGYFGSVPDFVQLLADSAPTALEGFFLMRQAALSGTQMPDKLMELLLCAVNAAEYQPRSVTLHGRGARRAGATEAELVEACLVALPFAGLASWLPTADGVIASRYDGLA